MNNNPWVTKILLVFQQHQLNSSSESKMASLSLFAVPMRRKLKCARNSIKHEGTNFSTSLFPAFTDTTLFLVMVWLCSGFMLPLGMRLHCKRLPSGSNTIRCEFTWQIGRKSTEQHGCYESRSIKLNFSDSPAYYTTVLHKYNSPAVLCEKTQCKKMHNVTVILYMNNARKI